jgi:hypothetical protein
VSHAGWSDIGRVLVRNDPAARNTSRAVGMTVDSAAMAGQYVGSTVQRVIPVVRQRAAPLVQDLFQRSDAAVGDVVRENAEMEEYSGPVVVAAARATKEGVQYARGVLRTAAGGLIETTHSTDLN